MEKNGRLFQPTSNSGNDTATLPPGRVQLVQPRQERHVLQGWQWGLMTVVCTRVDCRGLRNMME